VSGLKRLKEILPPLREKFACANLRITTRFVSAQQCAGKYLKAILQEAEIPFGKTHHLIALLELVVNVERSWELLRPQLQSLNAYSVSVRYPGEIADKAIAREALHLAKTIRSEARQKIGLI
jgi:HEPN domain-containing protein